MLLKSLQIDLLLIETMGPHDEIDGNQCSDSLLPDDVLRVCQLSNKSRDVLTQTLAGEVDLHLVICGLHLKVKMLWHAYEQIDYAQGHEDDFEVWIIQQRDKEVQEVLDFV